MKKTINRICRAITDLHLYLKHRRDIPVIYFDEIKNIGDLVNPYLINKISGSNTFRPRTALFPHLRAVGSVLQGATKRSHVWGSGFIDGDTPTGTFDAKKIRALRGHKSLELLRTFAGLDLSHVPLGDPALLMPRFFKPEAMKKTCRLGVIPHFSEIDYYNSNFSSAYEDAHVVDVRTDPEQFVTQLAGCEYVLSSSLHGLILADAYGIPNKWIVLTDKLIGRQFKFSDYYSTTSSPDEVPFYVNSSKDFEYLVNNIGGIARVKTYEGNLDALLDSFPMAIIRKNETTARQ